MERRPEDHPGVGSEGADDLLELDCLVALAALRSSEKAGHT
jgi:hypothetical protein